MMNYIKLVLIGGTLTLVLLGLGGLSVVVGIDATIHGRALTPGRSVSKVRIHRNYQSRQIPDRTYLWGPGLVAFGTSAFLAGVMVIPSAVMMEHGRRHRHWPKVVVVWKAIRIGLAVGLGCVVLAGMLNTVLRF